MLLTFAGYLYGGPEAFRLYHEEIDLHNPSGLYSPKPEAALFLPIIEDRYQTENAMLQAVSKGDAKRALQYLAQYKGYTGEHRTGNPMRDRKNGYIVLNSLARKAAKNGYVHPAHIHAMSDDFARRIEAASTLGDLARLSEQMLFGYCSLVKKFSLRKFSPLIRNVINTIDFNLHEPLSLAFLAGKFYANPSNLSNHFRREKGMTLTNYINTKRMERAASLLRSTGDYIQKIAEQCGFLDINYFSHLFKRYYGLPPTKFREARRIMGN
ncbi:MAG: AraC family transcriptional regulator [Spirochaetaceae bacterium]|jgi:YesN/AraC family two-component response regulator|nr:AraC family transcriptional regulator [Spirochaetaceae bacterium]